MPVRWQAPVLEATPGQTWAQIRWGQAMVAPWQDPETTRRAIREPITELLTANADQARSRACRVPGRSGALAS